MSDKKDLDYFQAIGCLTNISIILYHIFNTPPQVSASYPFDFMDFLTMSPESILSDKVITNCRVLNSLFFFFKEMCLALS